MFERHSNQPGKSEKWGNEKRTRNPSHMYRGNNIIIWRWSPRDKKRLRRSTARTFISACGTWFSHAEQPLSALWSFSEVARFRAAWHPAALGASIRTCFQPRRWLLFTSCLANGHASTTHQLYTSPLHLLLKKSGSHRCIDEGIRKDDRNHTSS